jgi:hypothetical protein
MNLHAILARGVLMLLFGLGLAIAVAYQRHAGAAGERDRLLEPVLLPTVIVRPTAADLAMAQNDAAESRVVIAPLAQATPRQRAPQAQLGAPLLPRLGLDMPYYSFGKAMPRMRKE